MSLERGFTFGHFSDLGLELFRDVFWELVWVSSLSATQIFIYLSSLDRERRTLLNLAEVKYSTVISMSFPI